MSIGRRIKEVRRILNLKQKDMAESMRISQGYLCGIESEEKQANASVIFTLINRFNVNPVWLDEGTGEIFSGKSRCVFIKSAEVAESPQDSGYPMPKELIEVQLNMPSENLMMYQVVSDNMSPTLEKGDIVMIDRSDRNVENEGIYLFRSDDRRFIRRLLLKPEKHLANDNSKFIYGSIFLDSSIDCIGRIVWFCRKL